MKYPAFLGSIGLPVLALGACGDSSGSSPDDFPEARARFCYRADASVDATVDGEVPDSTADAVADVGADDGGAHDAAPAAATDATVDASRDGESMCEGSHPLLEGARRYWDTAACYCASSDTCYAAFRAEACCPEEPVCETPDAGPADAGCGGTHPLIEGTRRYCEPGACYSATPDSCHSAATAAACCDVDVACD